MAGIIYHGFKKEGVFIAPLAGCVGDVVHNDGHEEFIHTGHLGDGYEVTGV